MVALLDVNLLVAASVKHHSLYRPATNWMRKHATEIFASCPATQAGMLRNYMNPLITDNCVTFQDAVHALQTTLKQQRHQFWTETEPASSLIATAEIVVSGFRQMTDAYLLALAISRNAVFATLDRRVLALAPKGSKAREALVIVQ